ncbi:MAG: hypothetical protein GH144_05345 [Clostridia bacterium]|nr:hypothetical protein [Clostridia bacterium]
MQYYIKKIQILLFQRHRASIYFDVGRPGADYPGGKEGQSDIVMKLAIHSD